jgi:hypothetical protein
VEHRLYPEAVDNLCAALAAGATPAPVLDARVLIDLD